MPAPKKQWVEDPAHTGNPAVQLALSGADGTPLVKQWLVADPFADEVFLGPAKLAFQRAPAASMLEDFTNPPSDGSETDGILVDALRRPDVPDSGAGERGEEGRRGQERHPRGNHLLLGRCPARRRRPFHFRRQRSRTTRSWN